MVTYYVTLFASLLINYLPHHHFCLCGIYVTTYVTPTMTSLTPRSVRRPNYAVATQRPSIHDFGIYASGPYGPHPHNVINASRYEERASSSTPSDFCWPVVLLPPHYRLLRLSGFHSLSLTKESCVRNGRGFDRPRAAGGARGRRSFLRPLAPVPSNGSAQFCLPYMSCSYIFS